MVKDELPMLGSLEYVENVSQEEPMGSVIQITDHIFLIF